MVAVLNHKKFSWHNQPLDLEFGAAWGRDDGQGEGLYQMLGQLSWLSEQAGSERRVLALDEEQDLVVDQTTEQVRLLMRVKQVLKDRALMLYAQPGYCGPYLIEMWSETSADPLAEVAKARDWVKARMARAGLMEAA